jgi:ATP-dependent DNA helicase RecG
MIILDADRFGIAQLHQMRGRVRRSDYQAYCFLISKATNDAAINRLKLVEQNSDGFALAEEDLLIRGQGDIFGEKQTGSVNFKMADVVIDDELFDEANEEAEDIVSSGRLETEEFANLLDLVSRNYEEKKEILE